MFRLRLESTLNEAADVLKEKIRGDAAAMSDQIDHMQEEVRLK
jgi:hypothetical protein